MSRLARFAGRLGLVLGGTLAGLLAVEGLARVIEPPGGAHLLFDAPQGEPDDLVQVDPELRTALRPGFQGVVDLPGHRVELRVNTLGLRGPEVGPRDGRPRWLTIGDSFTLSAQVSEEQTFQAELARLLPGEVLNGGVDGDSTWQSSRRYLRVEPLVQPDGVLLVCFLGNDPLDNERYSPSPPPASPRPAAAQPLSHGLRPRLSPSQRLLFRHSFVHAQWRVWQRQRALTGRVGPEIDRWRSEVELFTAAGRPARERLLPQTRQALEELKGWTSTRGDRLAVALAPPAFAVDLDRLAPTLALVGLPPTEALVGLGGQQPEVDGLRDALVDMLGELAIPACDLTEPLRQAQARGDEPYLHYDGHWSPAGHAVVGQALAACLQ